MKVELWLLYILLLIIYIIYIKYGYFFNWKKKYELILKYVKVVDKYMIGFFYKVTIFVLGIFLGVGVNRWSWILSFLLFCFVIWSLSKDLDDRWELKDIWDEVCEVWDIWECRFGFFRWGVRVSFWFIGFIVMIRFELFVIIMFVIWFRVFLVISMSFIFKILSLIVKSLVFFVRLLGTSFEMKISGIFFKLCGVIRILVLFRI